MSVLISVDLGTTKITSLAIDADSGAIVSRGTRLNDANITASEDRARGRSEWDAGRIVELGRLALRDTAEGLAARCAEIVGVGITGQQHGVVLADRDLKPLTPLINWQDRRGHDPMPKTGRTYLETARERLGETAITRTGCRLQPGFLGLTLFWFRENGGLPAGAFACFIMDLFAAGLTGSPPVTDPSCAGSSGLLNVRSRCWDADALQSLGIPASCLPEIREANRPVGRLTPEAGSATGVSAGTPVFVPIGDHQASFLGSIRNLREDALVNVGTGAQVAVYTDGVEFTPPVELRPFPIHGNLLSNVGLAGGWSYQALENFFREIGREVFQVEPSSAIYASLNRLAAATPGGCDGLLCDPHFSGTRADPTRRGAFHGITPQNLTPGHFARSVLEGMGRSLADGYRLIQKTETRSHRRLVAAGNALRENAVFRACVEDSFGLPLSFTRHREEAAFGAALAAAVGAGVFPSLESAASRIAYE